MTRPTPDTSRNISCLHAAAEHKPYQQRIPLCMHTVATLSKYQLFLKYHLPWLWPFYSLQTQRLATNKITAFSESFLWPVKPNIRNERGGKLGGLIRSTTMIPTFREKVVSSSSRVARSSLLHDDTPLTTTPIAGKQDPVFHRLFQVTVTEEAVEHLLIVSHLVTNHV